MAGAGEPNCARRNQIALRLRQLRMWLDGHRLLKMSWPDVHRT